MKHNATKEMAKRRAVLYNAIAECGGKQKDFAEQIGVSHSTVSSWLQGTRSPNYKDCLAVAQFLDDYSVVEKLRPDIDWESLRDTIESFSEYTGD